MLNTQKWVPITHAAFLDYRVGAVHVSLKEKRLYKRWQKVKIVILRVHDCQRESGTN